ncbi:hypothetical protein LOTGIDRAFT_153688 [Lottia gigantea]|uniref:Myb/SANT-like DNA-binding domain-containing protein n=1 Tax=Lottia gigantea TaxID=225164 RepID=V3ZIY1_LOTGI|nr:hypothetical protein LOTGIDRAFT_153688 [Lottia gigantea]ESO91258.1 hypothetical protein LOTGIDRAFT_153688 [Lottia gigantea]
MASSHSLDKKRIKKTNFSKEEELLIQREVEKHYGLLSSKQSNEKKKRVWDNIASKAYRLACNVHLFNPCSNCTELCVCPENSRSFQTKIEFHARAKKARKSSSVAALPEEDATEDDSFLSANLSFSLDSPRNPTPPAFPLSPSILQTPPQPGPSRLQPKTPPRQTAL